MIAYLLELDNTNHIVFDWINSGDFPIDNLLIMTLQKGDGKLSELCAAKLIGMCEIKGNKFISKALEIRRYLSERGIRIVYLNGYLLSKYAILLKFISPQTVVVLVRHHNKVHHLNSNKRAHLIDKWAGRLCDKIIAVSNTVRETVLLEGVKAEKVSVIYNGVDIDRFDHNLDVIELRGKRRPWNLLALGRIVWEKDYLSIIQAMSNLRDLGIDFRLEIYGSGNDIEIMKLNSAIRLHKLDDRVFYFGFSEQPQSKLNEADILIHAAKDESFCMAILEGYISGIPVASVASGGPKEIAKIVGDVLGEETRSLVDKITVIMDNYEDSISKAKEYKIKAREIFNISKMAESYHSHIKLIEEEHYPKKHL